MKARAKSRVDQHLIDDEGTRLLESRLPRPWILRPYRPDYGIDFSLEVFGEQQTGRNGIALYETLGEHLFIQLKTVRAVRTRELKLYGRHNIEKRPESLDKRDFIGSLRVASQVIPTSELLTIERMGVGVPVLLVIADLKTQRCYFVCLNDYIDKILSSRIGGFRRKASRTIHVPLLNEVGNMRQGRTALRWYAKRPKLFAAFQRFVYQHGVLENEAQDEEVERMARHFASRIEGYDFWTDTEMWNVIARYGQAIRHFLKTGDATALRLEAGSPPFLQNRPQKRSAEQRATDILWLWKLLALLPRNYEDVCREWFLPTALGYLTTYQCYPQIDSLSGNMQHVSYSKQPV